jgi:hypothetical protein
MDSYLPDRRRPRSTGFQRVVDASARQGLRADRSVEKVKIDNRRKCLNLVRMASLGERLVFAGRLTMDINL